MQLVPAIFTLFFHYTCGKKSRKKAEDFSLFFILGTIIFNTVFFLSLYTVYFSFFYHFPNIEIPLFPWIMAGIFLALGFFSFFFYYRKSRGTELFISRSVSKQLILRAKNINSRSDAFMLGLFSGTAELLFTLPIFIITVSTISNLDYSFRPAFALLFIISPAIPIISYYTMYHSGYNLAEIQRRRVKNKPFFRLMISVGFILLVLSVINLGIIK